MAYKRSILLIDDDEQFLDDFQFFTSNDYDVQCTTNGEEAITHIRMQDPDVVLLDMCLNHGEDGLDLLRRIKEIDPDLPVIVITQYPTHNSAVKSIKLGAQHYIEKTPDLNTLKAIIDQQIASLPYRRYYREHQEKKYGALLGNSPAMQKLRKRIDQCALVDVPVLIVGESGTGKELVANAIHRKSARAAQPMFSVNCSTLSPSLFESEFFGHERGAFTGAFKRKKGKVEVAENSTLFLDEIGDLPPESQPKILEVIEYGRFQRVGGTEILHADVRIIAATNRNLQEDVENDRFREDLFYRLNVLNVIVPPLRERREDIPELIRHYLELACRKIRRPVPKIPDVVMEYWQSYHWPGNVRELQNKMMNVALETEGDTISQSLVRSPQMNMSFLEEYQALLELPYDQAKRALMDRFQYDYVKAALQRNQNNITKTANETGLHRSTIYRVLKKK
ncbi:MAG: sigma-54 dependent transcriptional regulator [candidate division KSB1 bacterium]|nr:sigma-54 dependent transcriptional regulator [candidate division KSB1 bacterium]